MTGRIVKPLIFFIAIFFFTAPHFSHADILLKAAGKAEVSLRPKILDSSIDIHGQFASIKTVLTMQSELNQQSEADFIYTVPDNTLVTYFAYWYKGEKVVARIVTKERAAEIYRVVTNQKKVPRRPQGDPALVEMEDKNTFHVRIFPIESNADLKVEIHSIQLLQSDAQGAVFTYPLQAPEKGKGTLEEIQLKINVHPDEDIAEILNNYNLPLRKIEGGKSLELSQQNWRAPQDLRVRLKRPQKALQTSIYAARAGGNDGFFALALTPSQDIAQPKLDIQGVKTYQLLPAKLPALKKHQTVFVTGRYHGAGAAKVLLRGYANNAVAQSEIAFSGRRETDNLAAQFWAQLRLQNLEKSPKNKAAIIELSKRFNLPSKYTSWLALPEEGRQIYEKNLAMDSLEKDGRELTNLIVAGKGKTSRARTLRAAIDKNAKIAETNPDDVLANQLAWQIIRAADNIVREKQKPHADPKIVQQKMRYMNDLLSYIPHHTNEYLQSRIDEIPKTDYRIAAQRYVEFAEKNAENTAESKALLGHINRMYEQHSSILRKPENEISDRAWEYSREISSNIAQEKIKDNPDERKIRDLSARFDRFAKATGVSTKVFLSSASKTSLRSAIQKSLLPPSPQNVSTGTYDENWNYSEHVSQTKKQTPILAQRLDISGAVQKKIFNESVYYAAQPLAQKYFSLQTDSTKNYVEQQKIRGQLEDLADAIGVPYEDLVDDKAREWARNQFNYPKPLPDKIVDLEESTFPDEGKLRILRAHLDEAVKILHYQPQHFTNDYNGGRLNSMWEYRKTTKTAQKYLEEVRYQRLAKRIVPKIRDANKVLPIEKELKHPDTEYVQQLEKERNEALKGISPELQEKLKKDTNYYTSWGGTYGADKLYTVRGLLFREYRKENPDSARAEELKHKFVEMEKGDWYLSSEASRYTSVRKITNPILYGNLRAQRLELRANREKLEEKIKAAPSADLKNLQAQRAQIIDQQKKLIARMGDPLISVEAPADAAQVVALMPDGEIKQLVYNVQSQRWEARFDIPTSAREGKYAITIIVVHSDGSRQMAKMNYTVDLTPPQGSAQAEIVQKAAGQTVRLEVVAESNTARVSALLPWGEKVLLQPSNQGTDQFFTLADVPTEYQNKPLQITIILTDKAHNRTSISVDYDDKLDAGA